MTLLELLAVAWLLAPILVLIVVVAACEWRDRRTLRRGVQSLLDGVDRLLAAPTPDPDGALLDTIQHGYQPESERTCDRIWKAS